MKLSEFKKHILEAGLLSPAEVNDLEKVAALYEEIVLASPSDRPRKRKTPTKNAPPIELEKVEKAVYELMYAGCFGSSEEIEINEDYTISDNTAHTIRRSPHVFMIHGNLLDENGDEGEEYARYYEVQIKLKEIKK